MAPASLAADQCGRVCSVVNDPNAVIVRLTTRFGNRTPPDTVREFAESFTAACPANERDRAADLSGQVSGWAVSTGAGYEPPRPTGTNGLTQSRAPLSATDSLPIPISRSIPVVRESIAKWWRIEFSARS